MSDNESEQSLDEELQHNNDEEVYETETVIKKGLDRKTNKTITVKKRKGRQHKRQQLKKCYRHEWRKKN